MYRNYLMLPEDIQRRPLRGVVDHRHHRPKKDQQDSETFTPISRAGRRVLGETKVKAAMANNAKKAEERTGVGLFKFIKKLDKDLAARLTLPDRGPTKFKVSPTLMATNNQGTSGCLPSHLTDMYEPMDTTLDNTQGPILCFVPQESESHIFTPPGLTQFFPPQHTEFELGTLMYQTAQPLEHQDFIDQDQRLRPPIDQQFHRGNFVMNQISPVHPHLQVNNHRVMEGHFPVAPHTDIGYPIHQSSDVRLLPVHPINHDRQFMLHPPAHKELVNQLQVSPLGNETVGHNDKVTYQDMGKTGKLVHLDNRVFDELFGNGDDDDDDDDDDDNQVEVVA